MKEFIRWAAQYVLAAASLFAILVGGDVAKGTAFAEAWASALAWAMLSSAIFIGARYYQARQNRACAVCETFQPK